MSPFEYLLVFAAVVLGLAISDLAMSLNKLLNAGPRVQWGVLTPLAAMVAFLKIITQWWTWYAAQSIAQALSFEMFVVVMIGSVLLFLMAASALPDVEMEAATIDLPACYTRVQRRFWILFTTHWAIMNGVSIWAQIQIQGAQLNLLSFGYLVPFATLGLAYLRMPWLHAASMAGLIVLYLVQFLGDHLTA